MCTPERMSKERLFTDSDRVIEVERWFKDDCPSCMAWNLLLFFFFLLYVTSLFSKEKNSVLLCFSCIYRKKSLSTIRLDGGTRIQSIKHLLVISSNTDRKVLGSGLVSGHTCTPGRLHICRIYGRLGFSWCIPSFFFFNFWCAPSIPLSSAKSSLGESAFNIE